MTAMMSQYMDIKQEYSHCLLFFRLGDFYELFFDDAVTASRELDIALTGRSYGAEERAPMCGVPHHAAEGYISKLVEKGYRVAVCEQTETPKPGAKGPVKREVVRVVTPGTITDAHVLQEEKNNYILCLHLVKKGCALAAADITTGAFTVTHFVLEGESSDGKRIIDEMAKFYPAEVLVGEGFSFASEIEEAFALQPVVMPPWNFSEDYTYKSLREHFKTMHLEAFGLKEGDLEIPAAGALLNYLQETQKGALAQITSIKPYSPSGFLILDKNTRKNLELTAPLRPWLNPRGSRGPSVSNNVGMNRKSNDKCTLLGALDQTCTAMGARLLRQWVEMPLVDVPSIQRRLDSVEEWANQAFLRAELRDSLKGLHDMERLMARLAGVNANGRDMAVLRASLAGLPYIREKLCEARADLNVSMYRSFDDLKDLFELLDRALVQEPPLSVREGGMFKEGYYEELDQVLNVKGKGNLWLLEFEERERVASGIKSLKVRYNRVFGYYIEITKSNLASVPKNYIRKQTLANCERFTTPELDELAETILNAEVKQAELELALFEGLRQEILRNMERVQFMANLTASLDVIQSLGDAADRNRYCKPLVNDGDTICIRAGRHPVIELVCPFVPNDTHLNGSDNRMAVITGPNMAGKSTYMRQVALITLMAQIGSFVPADEAVIGVVDRIFTRVGASDDLAGGMSTFMVEMTEVAHILHHATKKSLIVMDEIGRGTSTYDGLSIAWAALEYIADTGCIGAKTLFATHYHELTVMEERLTGVLNYSFAIAEVGADPKVEEDSAVEKDLAVEEDSAIKEDSAVEGSSEAGVDLKAGTGFSESRDVLFLRKLVRGGADKSYGIQVARLAGLPGVVLSRAKNVLDTLERAGTLINTEEIEPHYGAFADPYIQQRLSND